jgi:hypothetical protein
VAREMKGDPRITIIPDPPDVPRVQPVAGARQQTLVAQVTRETDLTVMTQFELDAQIWRLITLGWAFWRIQAALQLEHPREVTEGLERYLRSNELTDAQKRGIMVGQLDEAIERVMEILGHTHYKVHKGSLVMVPADPHDPASVADFKSYVPLIDDGPKLDTAKTLAVLLDRKAKLLGLDAPERHEHTILPLPGVAQNWVAQKRAQAIEGTTN